jgi:hypothetical protein
MGEAPRTTNPARFTDSDKEEARQAFDRVFVLLGLTSEGRLTCPDCGTVKAKKVYIKTGPSGRNFWQCYACGSSAFSHGEPGSKAEDAIGFYRRMTGVGFVDAVNAILGRSPAAKAVLTSTPVVAAVDSFAAVMDLEVYDSVIAACNLKVAQDYWSRWHISPEAVATIGSRVATNPKALARHLTAKFGIERLLACGLVTITSKGDEYFLLNDDYPVIEPQFGADGHLHAMQFRPSPAQRLKVEAHKAWKREHGEGASGGPKYVPPFMSPKGARPDTFVGYNLRAVAAMEPGSTVRVVEGCKDTLAFWTKGVPAYGIPGTGVMPPESALEVLRDRKVIVRLDGDKAGNEARSKIVDYLVANGVTAKPAVNVPEGLDVADLLVREYDEGGCSCETCTEWRKNHSTEG